MVRGSIENFGSSSGSGIVRHTDAYNKVALGSGFNASKRTSIALVTGLRSSEVSVDKAYLDVGFLVPKDIGLPLRLIISLDGITITREFKPQITAELEDGIYGKAVYEIEGLLGNRLAEKDIHMMNIVYTAAKPIVFEDAGLTIVYKGIEKSWHSMRLLTGAMVAEPGDFLAVDVSLPESKADIKNFNMRLQIPSRFANVKVEAADFHADLTGNIGNIQIGSPIKFKGKKLRVYVDYKKPERNFYPKNVLISSMLLYESSMPEAFLNIEVENIEKDKDYYKVKCKIKNIGHVKSSDSLLLIYALGIKLGELKIGPLAPSEERETLITVKAPKVSVPINKLLLRIIWSNYGLTRSRDLYIQI